MDVCATGVASGSSRSQFTDAERCCCCGCNCNAAASPGIISTTGEPGRSVVPRRCSGHCTCCSCCAASEGSPSSTPCTAACSDALPHLTQSRSAHSAHQYPPAEGAIDVAQRPHFHFQRGLIPCNTRLQPGHVGPGCEASPTRTFLRPVLVILLRVQLNASRRGANTGQLGPVRIPASPRWRRRLSRPLRR